MWKNFENYLPETLCFDEFKASNDYEGTMAFIFCNTDTGNITDILPNRYLSYLKEYFSSFSLEAHKKVKHIVIDSYKPYITSINDLFHNAKISLDRFHLLQLINRSFNKTRIKIMNQCKNKKDNEFKIAYEIYQELLIKNNLLATK